MYVMDTDAYSSLRFSAIFFASLLLTLLHSGAISSPVLKTRGVNENLSICQSRFGYTYPSLFHIVGRSLGQFLTECQIRK